MMSHKYKILEQMFKDGKITLQEFQKRCAEYHKELEQELMNDEITPDEHIERYNALIKMETQPFGPPGPHEHI